MDEAWHKAQAMKANNATWSAMERETGISIERLKRRFVPGFAELRAAQVRENRARRGDGTDRKRFGLPFYHLSADEAERALATVPPDTRNRTARFFGDPLPGRSARDKAAH